LDGKVVAIVFMSEGALCMLKKNQKDYGEDDLEIMLAPTHILSPF